MDFRWFTAAVLVALLTLYAPVFPLIDLVYDVPDEPPQQPVATGPCWVELPEWAVPEWNQPAYRDTFDKYEPDPSQARRLRFIVLVTSEHTIWQGTYVIWMSRAEYCGHRHVSAAVWAGWTAWQTLQTDWATMRSEPEPIDVVMTTAEWHGTM